MYRITILDASPKKLTKQFSLVDGKITKKDYDKCYLYEYQFADCCCLIDLYDVLKYLSTESSKCIIRAKLKHNYVGTSVVRQKRGDNAPFTENPDGVSFIMCDFDKIEIPEWLPTDLDVYLEYLISTLPVYMHDVSYVYQWSSQAGMDEWKTLRCHIWFWLSEPRTDTEVINWANSLKKDDNVKIIDDSVFRTVQPNYTAHPIFETGVLDPLLGQRLGLIIKKNDCATIPSIKTKKQKSGITSTYSSLPPPLGLENKFDQRLAAIGPDFHMPITQAVASWKALTGPNSDFTRLKQILRDRINSAPGEGSAGKAHYLSDEYLDAEIKGCPFAHKIDGPNRMPETQRERVRYKLSDGKSI
jgi:hypothetical protein